MSKQLPRNLGHGFFHIDPTIKVDRLQAVIELFPMIQVKQSSL